jgi:hypothetical protein
MRPSSRELHRLSVRLLFGICLGLTVFFTLETAFELGRQGRTWDQLSSSSSGAKSLASSVSRAFNNLLAMVLSFVAIAIPITANMYTPKLVEIFFADRVNLAALVYFAAMGAHALFGQWIMFDQWVPQTHVTVLWLSSVIGFAVVIPYYLYVLDFLNPETIIRRVRDRIVEAFPDGDHGPAARRRLTDRILQLGNVMLRAVDRADRDVTITAIEALESALLAYDDPRARAPVSWFEVEKELFFGHSSEAIAHIRKERIWVEQTCLQQLHLAYLASLAKMPDAVSAISKVNRRIANQALRRGDDATLGLSLRFFNTFVRSAVQKRDVHAVFDVFHQYRQLAIELVPHRPGRAREIARHMRYYAVMARMQGLGFVHELAASEVALVVEAAYAAKAPSAAEALAELREFQGGDAAPRLVKAEASLAAWFRSTGREAEAALLRGDLLRARIEDLETAKRDIAATDDPIFWEVTDRQTNLDYLPPDRRALVVSLLDDVLAERRRA